MTPLVVELVEPRLVAKLLPLLVTQLPDSDQHLLLRLLLVSLDPCRLHSRRTHFPINS